MSLTSSGWKAGHQSQYGDCEDKVVAVLLTERLDRGGEAPSGSLGRSENNTHHEERENLH